MLVNSIVYHRTKDARQIIATPVDVFQRILLFQEIEPTSRLDYLWCEDGKWYHITEMEYIGSSFDIAVEMITTALSS